MSAHTLLQKSIRTIRKEGVSSFFKKSGDYISHKTEPLKRVCAPYARYRINHLSQDKLPASTLIDFMFHNFGGLIRPAQVKSEITALGKIVETLEPKTILEIGTAKGGTLFLFSRLADPRATIVSLDLPGGEFGGGYPEWKSKLYKTFARPLQHFHLLRDDSHLASVKEKVMRILNGTPLDFLFIDGDHTYEGVKKDFELYAPLVRKGGVIAFHDIAVHPPEVGCQVDRFWNEIKGGKGKEFIENRDQKWAGIGVYYNS